MWGSRFNLYELFGPYELFGTIAVTARIHIFHLPPRGLGAD